MLLYRRNNIRTKNTRHQIKRKIKDTKDVTDYFQKDWRKYLESEEGKKYLEEINKNYDNYLNGKE